MGMGSGCAPDSQGATPTIQIRPATGRPDWWVVPQDAARRLGGAPGLILDAKARAVYAHRSMLPLIQKLGPLEGGPVVQDFSASRAGLDARCAALGFTPRSYQHVAREFAIDRTGTLIADQQRLGKTLTALLIHGFDADGPMVTVGPVAVKKVWLDWAKRLWPGKTVAALTSRTYDRDRVMNADFLFVNYDILSTWQSFARRRFATIAFDEAHVLSDPKSQRTKAAMVASTSADRVLALTGTPLWNKPANFFPILNLISVRGAAFGGYYDFAKRYASGMPGPHGFTTGAPSRADELQARLSEVMIRRTWKDVRAELPTISRSVEVVELNTKEVRQIDTQVEQLRTGDHASFIEKLTHYRRVIGTYKQAAATQLALRFLDSEESVVVWVWHRELADEIQRQITAKKRTAYTCTGAHSEAQREAALSAWRSSKTPSALIITMAVGQAGIDLSQARHAIFAELDFTPAVIGQAEMRTYSPERPMSVTFIVAEHWADMKLAEVLMTKCEMATTMGTPAAESALDVIGSVMDLEKGSDVDLDRLMTDILEG